MSKNAKQQLKLLKEGLRRAALITEADEPEDTGEPAVDGKDSLDEQVDGYLAGYESEAANSKKEGLNFRDLTRRVIFEADEPDPTTGEGGDDAGDEAPAAPPAPTKKTLKEIDIRAFASGVSRLIENAESLLEFRNTLLRRAANYLGKSYDTSVLRHFEIIMEDEHGLVVGKSPDEVEDDFQAPIAQRAAASSGAGG